MYTKEPPTAPDGGWGWIIVFAYSLNNLIAIPILQGFGLLYRDLLLVELLMSATDISAIITINLAFGMLLGLVNGPILKKFGYRKVAFVGALLIFGGNAFTSQANSFWEFIFYYSIIVSIGINFVMSSFSLALNTYFVKKRAMATGIAMTISGIGPIITPLIINALMNDYKARGTGLIFAGLSLHSLLASLLLQPVKWHYRRTKEEAGEEKQSNNIALIEECGRMLPEITIHDAGIKNAASCIELTTLSETHNMSSFLSMPVLNNSNATLAKSARPNSIYSLNNTQENENDPPVKSLDDVVKSKTTLFNAVTRFFDLDLYSDMVYVNISLGLALAFISEMNFSLMIPFLLRDRGLDLRDTAVLMSVNATADLSSRFLSPIVNRFAKLHCRYVYLISLISGIILRLVLIFVNSFDSLIAVFIALGITKGFRTVYMALVIPNYVPLCKLPSATGLQIFVNGLFLLSLSPLLGRMRDINTNYNNWLHVINLISSVTIVTWSVEMLLMKRAKESHSTESERNYK